MRTISQEELNEILRKHQMWLNDDEGGEKANLRNANLRYADLSGANLIYSHLSGVDFRWADLRESHLLYACLIGSSLVGADLRCADLIFANLSNVDLRMVNLENANLQDASLQNIKGYNIISVQINTSRNNNNMISYWKELDVVTTGCFQGSLEELKKQVQKTHKDNHKIRTRYEKAIEFIEDVDVVDIQYSCAYNGVHNAVVHNVMIWYKEY